MANKPLQFVIVKRKLNVGKHAGKTVQIARPTGRHRVDFRNFCDRVAKSTTFNRQEVEAVLNYATEIAKDIVSNGDIVEFGDLGTLMPVVLLAPSKKYFTLTDVSYEQTVSKQKKDGKKPDKPKEKNESPGGGGVGI